MSATPGQIGQWLAKCRQGPTEHDYVWAVNCLAAEGLGPDGKPLGEVPPKAEQPAQEKTASTEYTAEARARNEASYPERKKLLIAAADAYDKLGFCPIKIPPKSKAPQSGWNKQHITGESAPGLLDADDNIGVHNGEPSHHVIDLDLDWPEAAAASDIVFANLPAFGRTSKLRSHRLVKCPDIKSVDFKLPPSCKDDLRFGGEHGLMICEIRSTGKQTVFPPSFHPSGEQITWEGGAMPEQFPEISPGMAQKSMALVALTALTIRCDPAHGDHYYAMLPFVGAALRITDNVGAIERLVGVICKAWGTKWPSDQVQVGSMKEKIDAGEEVTGLPTLLKHLGLPEDLARTINREWIGIDDGRPRVVIDIFDTNGTLDQLNDAMLAAKVPVYRRGPQLVHVIRMDKDNEDEFGVVRHEGSLGIHKVGDQRMGLYFDKYIAFYSKNPEGKLKLQPSTSIGFLPPQFKARIDQCSLPVLDNIIEVPTLRDDGSLLIEQGYDPTSRLVLASGNLKVPPIPESPTQADAVNAMKVITDTLNEFAFVTDNGEPVGTLGVKCASRSVAASAMLTGIVRRGMVCAPIHGFDANDVGTGKSTLCDVIAIVLTGREAPAMTLPPNEEEAQKALLSVLMNGDPVISIDNVMKGTPVGGGVLAKIVTQTRFKARVLGANIDADVPTNVLILVNGNNLTYAGDLASRAINSRMNAGCEHPENRTFNRDIVSYVKEHRAEIVGACLTVLRAYIVGGRPKAEGFVPSRFKQWDSIVRGSIAYAGEADPYATVCQITENDPERNDLATLMNAFEQCFGVGKKVTSKQIAAMIPNSSALRDALGSDGLGQRLITAKLKSNVDQIVGGKRFRRHTNSSQVVEFWIEIVKAVTPELELVP